MRTRLAPTPSGYLHVGNAVNFTLISLIAQQLDLQVALRIDDMDATRVRPEYIHDIFTTIRWLGIDYDFGPRTPQEFAVAHTCQLRRDDHWSHVQDLLAQRSAFACECSRTDVRPDGRPACVRDCRHRAVQWLPGSTSIKVRIDGDDVVIWRRDDLPAYHLASVVDDINDGTTHIIRGADLEESTRVQSALAELMGLDGFTRISFWHHPLILDATGHKLSKSQIKSGPMSRTPDDWERIRAVAEGMLADMDLYGSS